MSKVDLKTIYPAEFTHNHFNPALGICGETIKSLLERTEEEIPRLKTLIFQNRKIGVLRIGGDLREVGFNKTNTDTRANKCDALVIYFDRDVSFPKEKYDDNTNMEELHKTYPHIVNYFELPKIVQLFLMGIEQTLLRRVIAIGQEVCYTDVAAYYKWIEIPKNRVHLLKKEEKS